MKQFDQIFKTTTLELVKKVFDFLVFDFGYKIMTAEKVDNFRADNFFIYRNEKANIQIEICADENWFHAVIRRLVNHVPADYNDKLNCLSFEDLAIWESENQYDHFDYYVGGQTGLKGVLENTAKLFKRNEEILTTNTWLDTNKIQNLKDKDFVKKFGIVPDRNKPTFFENLKLELSKILAEIEYEIFLDSDKVSPFDQNSMTNILILKRETSKIEITQKDWREDFFIYEVFKNDNKVFLIDVSEMEIDRAVELVINKIKYQ
jgi:hypothetical protein